MDRFYVVNRKDQGIFVTFLLLGIIGFVGWIVLLLNARTLSEDLKDSHLEMYFLGCFLVFTVVGIIYYFNKRIVIAVDKNVGSVCLEIKDSSLPSPLILNSPFVLSAKWIVIPVTHRLNTRVLFLTVSSSIGEPLVTFTTTLATVDTVPDHFEFINMTDRKDQQNLVKAQLVYTTNKTEELSHYLKVKQ
mgnify:CR=1 FL=1